MALTILFAACGDIHTDVAVRPDPSPTSPIGAGRYPSAVQPALGPPLTFVSTVERQAREGWWYATAQNAARRTTLRSAASRGHTRVTTAMESGSGRCGGDLPSCAILACESGGNIRAENPSSTASGKWQVLDTTWGGYGGYSHAADAPESVQDERARQIWAGGRGRSQWVC